MDIIEIDNLHHLFDKDNVNIKIANKNKTILAHHDLSERQKEIILAGSLINWVKKTR
jgi:hypothetical protein